ncbi:hypothetical protein MT997_32385 [Paenibacillus sp. OVF10]|nr:hypothetical protein MT997_32385 [Paenibacillus sp. OVF10]
MLLLDIAVSFAMLCTLVTLLETALQFIVDGSITVLKHRRRFASSGHFHHFDGSNF